MKKSQMTNKFSVVIEKNTGLYLQEHRMYGSYPLMLRVILTKNLHEAKHFPNVDAAVKHLRSRTDYREPVFDWQVQTMEATNTDETLYPVQLREGGD